MTAPRARYAPRAAGPTASMAPAPKRRETAADAPPAPTCCECDRPATGFAPAPGWTPKADGYPDRRLRYCDRCHPLAAPTKRGSGPPPNLARRLALRTPAWYRAALDAADRADTSGPGRGRPNR